MKLKLIFYKITKIFITISIFTYTNIINANINKLNINSSNGINVTNAWARATVAKQTASGVFLSIKANKNLTLFKVSSILANKTEIHTMIMQNNTMYMQPIDKLNIPKDQTIALNGEYHLMLFGLKQKLQVGSEVPVKLYFKDDTQNIIEHNINAIVKPIYYSEK